MLLLPGSGYVMSGCTGREKKRARVSLPGHVPTNEPDKLVLAVPAHLGTYPRYLDRIHCMVAPPRIPVDATHNSWATKPSRFPPELPPRARFTAQPQTHPGFDGCIFRFPFEEAIPAFTLGTHIHQHFIREYTSSSTSESPASASASAAQSPRLEAVRGRLFCLMGLPCAVLP